jgi:hypothetical protein
MTSPHPALDCAAFSSMGSDTDCSGCDNAPTIVRPRIKSRNAIGNTACGAAALHDFSQKFMAGLARRTPFSKGCMVDTVHSQAFTA